MSVCIVAISIGLVARPALAAIVNPGQTLTINGTYPDDKFIIQGAAGGQPAGVLVLNYNGSIPFDYGRGTVFEGDGILRKTGSGSVFGGIRRPPFSLAATQ